MKKKHKNEKSLIKWGFGGAILASACCWLPLILVFLGVISVSTVLKIGYRSNYFLIGGLTLIALGIFFYWRKRGACSTRKEWIKQILFTILIVALVLLVAYVIKHWIVPYLAPFAYEKSLNQ